MLPKIIEYLENKSVLILGFGREGQSTLAYIRKYLPEKKLTVSDRNPIKTEDENVTVISGEDYLECINNYDVVMKSPGISFREVDVSDKTEITCQVDLFLRFAQCRKIGITGSKGKTTTSTLTYEMLKAAGKDTKLIGNIGVPVFEALQTIREDSYAVIEMSSHQLEFTKASPDIAILTNVYEEHLDHYRGGFSGYIGSKLHIMNYQNKDGVFIYNATQGVSDYVDLSSTQAKKIGVYANDELPFEVTNEHLLGEHNRQDILFAYNAVKTLGVSDEECRKGVENFSGIEHRMEKVGTFKQITFYNDCIATIPHAVECAIEALKEVDTLIFGGKDRGIDYSEFCEYLENCSVKNLIGTPETAHKILDKLEKANSKKNLVKANDLDEAVRKAYELTEKGKICLLSPAASSYNVYKNFEQKGKHYKELIKKYGG